MTDALQRFLDPEVVARIANLELRARQIVEGMISGRHRSPFRGYSVEFAQHREYTRGDDLRHLDWKAWAKSDRLYIKQFEEETNLRTTIVLDASESMAYGGGDANKYEYACRLAATVAYLLLRQSDAVGLVTFDDEIRTEVTHRNPVNHLHALLHAMHVESPKRKTDLHRVLVKLADKLSGRGLIVLISDFLADADSVLKGMRMLRQRQHDVMALHVLHRDEVEFLFQGPTRFEGMESPAKIQCDPRALRSDYLNALNRYLTKLKLAASNAGVDYRLVRTDEPESVVLTTMLQQRAAR